MEKRTISISLPEDLIKKIDEQANEVGINRSAYVTVILFDYFKKEELMKSLPDILSKMTKLSEEAKNLNDIKKLIEKSEVGEEGETKWW